MTLNVGGYYSERGVMHSWINRAELILEVIQNYHPDLIGCQEVQQGNLAFFEQFLTNYNCHLGVKTFVQDEEKMMYNPIFWKKEMYEKCDSGGFYLSENTEIWSKSWDSMFVRGATWIKLRCLKSGNKFVLLNTHLDHSGEEARIEGSKLIIEQITKIRGEEMLPVVLLGDFNSRAWAPSDENVYSYPDPIISNCLPEGNKVYTLFKNGNFKDTYLEAGNMNRLNMNTYHDFYGEDFPPVALRIDWILVSNGLNQIRTKKYEIIRNARPPKYPSDHYPILTEFCWENKNVFKKRSGFP